MIVVVDALNANRFGDLLDDMYRLRARVFGDRLGWDVKIENGREIDEFDHLNPAYVIGIDDEGHVIACVRALQTTGPHMLADVFSSILDGEPPLRSATIWESTRFCVDTERLDRGTGRNSISYATCELMIGSLEYAQSAGITDIVTVIDPVMDRVLKRSDNAPYGYVGSRKPMGKVSALAALLDCSDERIDRVRRFAGIEGDVFADDDEVRALLDARATVEALTQMAHDGGPEGTPRTQASRAQVLEYFRSQIEGADSVQELEAALRIAEEFMAAQPDTDLQKLLERQLH